MKSSSLKLLSYRYNYTYYLVTSKMDGALDQLHLCMQLMVNPSSRDYLVRIWGKTRSRGKVRSGPALTELCREIFEGVVACVGYLASSHGWLGDEFLFLSHPCDRQVSREGRRDRIQPTRGR